MMMENLPLVGTGRLKIERNQLCYLQIAFKPVKVVDFNFKLMLNSFLIDKVFMRSPRLCVRRIMHFEQDKKLQALLTLVSLNVPPMLARCIRRYWWLKEKIKYTKNRFIVKPIKSRVWKSNFVLCSIIRLEV